MELMLKHLPKFDVIQSPEQIAFTSQENYEPQEGQREIYIQTFITIYCCLNICQSLKGDGLMDWQHLAI